MVQPYLLCLFNKPNALSTWRWESHLPGKAMYSYHETCRHHTTRITTRIPHSQNQKHSQARTQPAKRAAGKAQPAGAQPAKAQAEALSFERCQRRRRSKHTYLRLTPARAFKDGNRLLCLRAPRRRFSAFQDEKNLYMLLEYIIGGAQSWPKKVGRQLQWRRRPAQPQATARRRLRPTGSVGRAGRRRPARGPACRRQLLRIGARMWPNRGGAERARPACVSGTNVRLTNRLSNPLNVLCCCSSRRRTKIVSMRRKIVTAV